MVPFLMIQWDSIHPYEARVQQHPRWCTAARCGPIIQFLGILLWYMYTPTTFAAKGGIVRSIVPTISVTLPTDQNPRVFEIQYLQPP